MNDSGDIWLTKKEVQVRYSVSRWTVDRWVNSGKIKAYSPDGDATSKVVRYKLSEIEAMFMEKEPVYD